MKYTIVFLIQDHSSNLMIVLLKHIKDKYNRLTKEYMYSSATFKKSVLSMTKHWVKSAALKLSFLGSSVKNSTWPK